MNFHRYETTMDTMLKGTNHKPSWQEFYARVHSAMAQEMASSPTQHNTLAFNHMIAEELYYERGKPYYKVWPRMVDNFVGTRLDIPAKLLRSPHPSFAVCLPTDPILDFTFENQPYAVKTLLVLVQNEVQSLKTGVPKRMDQHNLHVWMDIGEKYHGTPLFTWRHGIFQDEGTIEEGFQNLPTAWETMEGVIVPMEITEACVRLAVAVCFLASGGERVIERDVLSRHLDEYRNPNTKPDRKAHLEDVARRNGLGGWHIGRGRSDRELKLARGMSYEDAIRQSGGRQLLYQHVRGGHFHTVRFGKGRQEAKVVYYDAVMVRSDLPPKPMD